MIIELAAFLFVATFVGITLVGHVLVFRAIFAQADHIGGTRHTLPEHGSVSGLKA